MVETDTFLCPLQALLLLAPVQLEQSLPVLLFKLVHDVFDNFRVYVLLMDFLKVESHKQSQVLFHAKTRFRLLFMQC
jgi:hypothetical protein